MVSAEKSVTSEIALINIDQKLSEETIIEITAAIDTRRQQERSDKALPETRV